MSRGFKGDKEPPGKGAGHSGHRHSWADGREKGSGGPGTTRGSPSRSGCGEKVWTTEWGQRKARVPGDPALDGWWLSIYQKRGLSRHRPSSA